MFGCKFSCSVRLIIVVVTVTIMILLLIIITITVIIIIVSNSNNTNQVTGRLTKDHTGIRVASSATACAVLGCLTWYDAPYIVSSQQARSS